jgi:hypothetical protein
MHKKIILALLIALSAFPPIHILAQAKKTKPATKVSLPAIAAIRPSELSADLFEMSSDHFRGREAGTPDELKVSAWLAEKARVAGLQPAGDDGTFFQFFSLWRHRMLPSSTIKIGDSTFQLWKDVLVADIAPAKVSAPIVFYNPSSPGTFDTTNIKGKAVAVLVSIDSIPADISVAPRRYPGFIFRKYGRGLIKNGAAAIIFIADSTGETGWKERLPSLNRGLYDIEGGENENVQNKPPVLWVHGSALSFIKRPELKLDATLHVQRFEYPSVNVVGMIKGTDKELSKEFVLYSAHQDHDGVRPGKGDDSIYNGADDNATVSVALLAIARTFKAQPAKRSVLFVWHGAEERGLLGSNWFSSHPTVPFNAIAAVLNGDMIGRNHPDSAALLGARPPHRNSADLVNMALEANNQGPGFKLDTLWDKPEHPEIWYFRSDHLPYARAGIPSIFYSTLLHAEYHTPEDEASRIDIKKLTRMTQWMYKTGWKVANAPERPKPDPGFKLER